ncbi:putative lipopolysaccharide transport protein B: ATP-binding component of ABC superfamily [Desulforamulus hydrothermalis Lam5 = DSM 18033]|uniref:Putative lipopolysaccharide transport protein B: ATP-binding component of ABC superfamily n=1 Tax=Desulforamulus hydrothermalis Lam5 = DSM 18033 TaxID=1121428 RepID=K8DZ15_9FIRM|nr:putative lipopolysaccharide transport protein B: ATP-binding component of ABC superfamily [Desulforamulus hydrothermalis Lam5 = DSM 18033]
MGRWMKVLKIEDLHVYYGGIHALKGISMEVPENKIVTLVGANGAGKSTTLRAVSGLVPAAGGRITWRGEEITGSKTVDIVKKGITLVPEGRRIFANLTVLENLHMGAYARTDKEEIKKDINKIYEMFPRLREREWQAAGTLSGGEQQMLAIGRALMSRPKLLMMDEPSLGLAPLLVKEVFRIIKEIHSQGMTILLIEQNARAALQVADYGYVLETGRIVLQGPGQELAANAEVQKAYLGRS